MNIPKENIKEWNEYRERELLRITPMLSRFGFSLDKNQIHTIGERFLMSGKKLVLTGKRISDEKKVIIKASSSSNGKKELSHEHLCRETIKKIDFAYKPILLPEEILFARKGEFTVIVSEFIGEPKAFLEHADEEQFFLSLGVFKMFESVHATAYSHIRIIRTAWNNWGAREYLRAFSVFSKNIIFTDQKLRKEILRAGKFLTDNEKNIERYSGFLTHEDFVPHNFRVVGGDIYLLDHTAILFGNKYESFARFLNYLCLYNLKLERWMVEYIKKNRGEGEYLSLRLMRIYKIGELLQFYTGSLAKTEGDLHLLAEERISFWKNALDCILNDTLVTEEMVFEYKKKRDLLRSDEEKRRQRELHQL
jgi:hypothetical protein